MPRRNPRTEKLIPKKPNQLTEQTMKQTTTILTDDKAKAKAEAKLPLLDSALKSLQASVPAA